ncbi:TetR/AcrR family transcriptional regulator [Pseudonocardia sp. NPDC049635]|uniref:TetR/AcrR family transcriptional regulator n=1 Tax=Pseudonocardia sp. NPDC049635 TaxID=3155506 RepID=UPI0033D2CF55
MSRGRSAAGNARHLRADGPHLGRDPESAGATADRVLSAARRVVEDFGLRRFTMDQVARRGRVSRMTVYRHYPRKDELIHALLMAELRRFTAEADAILDAEPTVDGKLAAGVRFCVERLRRHAVLTRLLRTEPGVLLPHLTTAGGPVIAAATEWISRHVRNEIGAAGLQVPSEHVQPVAELLVRLVVSLVLNPTSTLDLDSDEGWERVRTLYLAPFLAVLARPDRTPDRSVAPVVPADPAASTSADVATAASLQAGPGDSRAAL